MQGLRGLSAIIVTFFIFCNSSLAAEVVGFPKKRSNKNFCRNFLSSTTQAPARGQTADIVQIDSYRSEFISHIDFLNLYSYGPQSFNPHSTPVFVMTPRSIADFKPNFTSTNFSRWRPLNSQFIVTSQQESYILMGFTPRDQRLAFRNNAFPKGSAIEYQRIMMEYAPTHHTTFVVPRIYRLILSTIEHVRSSGSYLMNENALRAQPFIIDYSIIFSRTDNIKYAARDFVSSWRTNNSIERQLQEFLIRFIDLKVKNHEEIMFEKQFMNEVIAELHKNFKTSSEVTNSLTNLENDLLSILRLSRLEY